MCRQLRIDTLSLTLDEMTGSYSDLISLDFGSILGPAGSPPAEGDLQDKESGYKKLLFQFVQLTSNVIRYDDQEIVPVVFISRAVSCEEF